MDKDVQSNDSRSFRVATVHVRPLLQWFVRESKWKPENCTNMLPSYDMQQIWAPSMRHGPLVSSWKPCDSFETNSFLETAHCMIPEKNGDIDIETNQVVRNLQWLIWWMHFHVGLARTCVLYQLVYLREEFNRSLDYNQHGPQKR